MTSEKPEKSKVDSLDDILKPFNVFGAYHRRAALLIFIAFLSNGIYCMNFIFIAEGVDYRCKPNRCETITNIKTEQCTTNIFPKDDESCLYRNKTILQDCKEWDYSDDNSFVAEFGIACEEWKRTLVGTVHSFGYMVGLLIIGPISDRIGRKNAFIATGIIGGVFGVTRSFVQNYWFYIILEFLEAAIGDSCSPMFMLAVEIVATTNRPVFYMITQLGYPTGGFILALVSWLVPYYRNRLQILYTPALLFFLYHFLLDESPRWLLTKGEKEKAVAIIENAASVNGIAVSKETLNNLAVEEVSERVGLVKLLKMTLKSKVMLKRFLVCLVWWTTCTFTGYGLSLNSVSLAGNKYLNYCLVCLVELPAGLLAGYLLKKFKRKWSLLASFAAGAVFLLIQPFLPTNFAWLSIILYMCGKSMSAIFFTITYVYTSELFPTYTRNSMHALCSSLGRIGSIVATQTPLLMVYWSGLPSVLFGVASLAAAATTLLVPDTGDESLPDTVAQAEAVGKKTAL